jgi:hypothetical protein
MYMPKWFLLIVGIIDYLREPLILIIISIIFISYLII